MQALFITGSGLVGTHTATVGPPVIFCISEIPMETNKDSDSHGGEDVMSWGSPLSRPSDDIPGMGSTPVETSLDFLDEDEDERRDFVAAPAHAGESKYSAGLPNKYIENDFIDEENFIDKATIIPEGEYGVDENGGSTGGTHGSTSDNDSNLSERGSISDNHSVSDSVDRNNGRTDIKSGISSSHAHPGPAERGPPVSGDESSSIRNSVLTNSSFIHNKESKGVPDFLSSGSEEFEIPALGSKSVTLPLPKRGPAEVIKDVIAPPVVEAPVDRHARPAEGDRDTRKESTPGADEKINHIFEDETDDDFESAFSRKGDNPFVRDLGPGFNSQLDNTCSNEQYTSADDTDQVEPSSGVHEVRDESGHSNIPAGRHQDAHTTTFIRTPAQTPSVDVDHTKKSHFGPATTTRFQAPAIVKFAGNTLLRFSKTTARRFSNNTMVERPIYLIERFRPVLPDIKESSFKDRSALEIAEASMKDPTSGYLKAKSILHLRDEQIFKHDVTFSISKDVLNGSKELFASPGELVSSTSTQLSPLELAVLRHKLGLPVSFKGIEFSPHLLKAVIDLNSPELSKAFVLAQKNRIVFLTLFLKLETLQLKDFASLYSRNLYYRFILSKAGLIKKETSKGGWNMKSIFDYGVSKILNVEAPKESTDPHPLENLLPRTSPVPTPDVLSGLNTKLSNLSTKPRVSQAVEPSSVVRTPDTASRSIEGGSMSAVASVDMPIPMSGKHKKTEAPTPSPSQPKKKSIFEESDEDDLFQDVVEVKNTVIAPKSGSKGASNEILPSREPAPKSMDSAPPILGSSQIDLDSAVINVESRVTPDLCPEAKADGVLEIKSARDIVPEIKPDAVPETRSAPVALSGLPQRSNVGSKSSQEGIEPVNTEPTLEPKPAVVSAESPPAGDASGSGESLYKKKYSKSFADIFTLEGQGTTPEDVDLSLYVSEVSEKDKPIFSDDTEKSSVLSGLFGLFRKKPAEPKKGKEDVMQARLNRPAKAEIQAPEKKERRVVQSSYANMKSGSSLDIPGFKPSKK